MSAGVRRRLDIAAALLTIGVALVVVAMSWGIVLGMLRNDTRTVVMEIPLAIPYSAFVIGFALIALFALVRVIALMRRRR
jgi:TRAP-type C4-dicarboxylate transport system permease small subunit